MRILLTVGLGFVCLAGVQSRETIASAHWVARAVATVQPEVVYAALVGHWTGSLEYRDFQSDKRVTLPTVLDVAATDGKDGLQWSYTYDDGPGKTVREKAWVRIPARGDEYIVKDEDGTETVYKVAEASGFQGEAGGKLILSGTGTDNRKAVAVRTTLEVTRQSLTILRETQVPGEEFKFRHQYRFTRSGEAQPSK